MSITKSTDRTPKLDKLNPIQLFRMLLSQSYEQAAKLKERLFQLDKAAKLKERLFQLDKHEQASKLKNRLFQLDKHEQASYEQAAKLKERLFQLDKVMNRRPS
uniref:Uncharacterized protein n=1 Tax=Globodera rostochiensis TaxID=31243 RepID=A0A914HU29_GLORO